MKAVIQRVKNASVSIENEIYSSINDGIVVLLGVEKCDDTDNAEALAKKIVNLRIFNDENSKMNLSVKDTKGSILVVSQFTVTSDCKKGTRPSFDNAAAPDVANSLYEYFVQTIKNMGIEVKTGVFAAKMQVLLVNDGPVTFVLNK